MAIVVFAAMAGAVAASSPAPAEPASARASAWAPRAETTTFNFSNIPVRSALQLIAEQGRFNLVVSDSVQGTVSLHLVNVTWEKALDIVLRLKGLHQRVDGDTRSISAD